MVQTRSLITRRIDFWFLGGASILLFLFIVLANPFLYNVHWIANGFLSFPKVFLFLSLLVNYPHFIVSYKFGYGRGRAFIFKNAFALIIIPLFLIGTLSITYFTADGNTSLSWFILAMAIFVGWHYIKQVFGSMMVYSRYDGYPVSPIQRKFLLSHLYVLAVLNFIFTSKRFSTLEVYGNKRVHLAFPNEFVFLICVLAIISFFAAVYFICYKNFKEKSILPSFNFIIPWVALIVWYWPLYKMAEYFWISIPFFHSLQYVPFAYRFEQTRSRLSKALFKYIILIAAGYLLFEGLPGTLDESFSSHGHIEFFLGAFGIFLNIHHYFIDSVVWKFKDPEIRSRLF